MRKDREGRVVVSPTDVVGYLGSPWASWMDRLYLERPEGLEPDEPDEDLRAAWQRGLDHEAGHLRRLRGEGPQVVEVERGPRAFERTIEAMRAGEGCVYQAALGREGFQGYADFLHRVPGASALGDWHYEPEDTKLALDAKPSHLLQLCAYADLLETAQGRRPSRVHVVVKSGERRTFRTDDYFYAYARVRDDLLEMLAAFDPARPPEPDAGGDWGRWESHAVARLEATDHLSRVAGITAAQVRRLEAAGIRTLRALAASATVAVGRLPPSAFERLRDQARLQKASEGKEVPASRVVVPGADAPRRGLALLPPASPGDAWFDMEGFPWREGGLEYLLGATTKEGRSLAYEAWWAHDRAGERRALERFVDWVRRRRREHPGMHVYHYAPYETTALKRLAQREATREDALDDLLRAGVFVDLHAIVRQGVRVGVRSYSLKSIERLYQGGRSGAVVTAGDSVAAYQRWLDSGEPSDPERSPLLAEIRDYNRADCDSTFGLTKWLRERQAEHGIAWAGPARPEEEEGDEDDEEGGEEEGERLARHLLGAIPDDPAVRAQERDRWDLQERLGHLVLFHRREEKPVWWTAYERAAMSEEELVEDPYCLGGLAREPGRPVTVGRSPAWWYRFDPAQETRIEADDRVFLADDRLVQAQVAEMDPAAGRLLLKVGASALERLGADSPPRRLGLIPDEFVSAKVIEGALRACARGWADEGRIAPALRDFLLRRPPRVEGGRKGPLRREGEDAVDCAVRVVRGLRASLLAVQGPPGTGKTWTAAHAILALLKEGRRVGVASNSHKAVLRLLAECASQAGGRLRCVKVGGGAEDGTLEDCEGAAWVRSGGDVPAMLATHPLVGGTAWCFAREELAGAFDHLFVDEAGQVSVANMVGMARAARNLVLLGDQMQLGQPIQGSHPGESGLSALEHFLGDAPTVADDMGVFLARTRRMHPEVCRFVSETFYEGRLVPVPGTERRVVRAGREGEPEAGVVYWPVEHEGNTQSSDEEVEAVVRIVRALRRREHTGRDGRSLGTLRPEDVLVVAPYNLQVRRLKEALGDGARVGTVDKFQGQEAPVVVVSLCASRADASPRGVEFVLDPHRLNVALSRAQSLAIVVGSPTLARSRCSTVAQMARVNTYCRILAQARRGGRRA